MKILGLIAVLCLAVALVGCGEGSSSGETAKLTKPEVDPPPGPPPKKLVIRDLVEGSGPGAQLGDALTVQYVGVNMKDEELFSSWTRRRAPLTFALGGGTYNFPGWEKGLEGMKEGGRRELWIPGYLALGEPLFYVVDLLKIQ